MRLVQGFALGGDLSVATVLTMEHAEPGRRGYFGSWVQAGGPRGLVVANLVFLPIAALPQEAFSSCGWRVPFLLSAVLVVVGYVIRRRIGESRTFVEVKKTGNVDKYPALELLRTYPMQTLLVAGSVLCVGVTFYIRLGAGSGSSTPRRPSDRAVSQFCSSLWSPWPSTAR
ncbi:MAG: hypothetical protein QOI30_1861 [Mycobacterium sp.]|nr:hypothetical protein [Mycobacterium sp.]